MTILYMKCKGPKTGAAVGFAKGLERLIMLLFKRKKIYKGKG